MRTDYTQVFTDAEAVEKYEHVVYAPDSYSSAVNRRQRGYLRGLVTREFPYRRPVQHDRIARGPAGTPPGRLHPTAGRPDETRPPPCGLGGRGRLIHGG